MENINNLRFRWNGHVPHLSKVFSEQRIDEQYCDTTLVSEDGYIIKAHCIILTMTSGYFERTLRNISTDQHPIMILDGVNYKELSCIMDYIYQGMTQVDQALIPAVLDLADLLEIKGLSKIKSNSSIRKLIAPSSVPVPQNDQSSGSSSPANHKQVYSPVSAKPVLKVDTEDNDSNGIKKCLQNGDASSDKVILNAKDIIRPSQKSEYLEIDEEPQNSLIDSVDQTLGIDLSLSKSGEITSDKDFEKSLNLQEDTPLRKRKIILEKQEEIQCSAFDPDFGKLDDKNENVPYKKKKRFGQSSVTSNVELCNNSSSCKDDVKDVSHEFTLEKLTNLLRKEKFDKISTRLKRNSEYPPTTVITDKNSTDSEVEVSCSDGGLTISVSTGADRENLSDPVKQTDNRNNTQVCVTLKKCRKRGRTKREIEEAKKRWLAKERRNLFSTCLLRRPNTRSLIKQRASVTEDISTESLSINCDPPFPTDENSQSPHQTSSESKDKGLTSLEEKYEKEVGGKKTDELVKTGKSESSDGNTRKNSISPLTLFTLPPAKEKEKQTRTSLTLEEKIKVIEAFLDGKSQRQIARIYGIGKTQVNGIVKKREEILSLYRENIVSGEKLTMKRQRKSEYAILNEHLIKWYRHMTLVAGIKITTGMLRAKALQIAPELGCHDFKGSNGWLATFKANNNLKFSKCKPKKTDSMSTQHYQEESINNEEEDNEFFDEETEEDVNLIGSHNTSSSSAEGGGGGGAGGGGESSSIHIGVPRGEPHLDVGSAGTVQPGTVSNISLGNSILATGTLPKPPQMSNMTIGSNLAYNLARDHTRSDMTRGEISHLSDLHSSAAVNASSIPHPALSKPDAALTYKSEDALSYGYDPQARMNEGSSRGTAEYNYTHYGFPSTYYGYHFLGQY